MAYKLQPNQTEANGDAAAKVEMAKAGAEKLGITWDDARHYLAALAKWGKAGFVTRERAEVERIEREICKPCGEYRDGRCKSCRCRVNKGPALVNKIAMATEHCKKGKW